MHFEWDEAKRRFNLRKHGVDFQDMLPAFDGRVTLEWRSDRRDEPRIVRLAELRGIVFHIVYTVRGEAIRFISARRASRYERKAYYASQG